MELTGLGLSPRVVKILAKAGIENPDQLKGLTPEKMKEIKGLGPKAQKEVQEKLEKVPAKQ